jgi:hypothetical protein
MMMERSGILPQTTMTLRLTFSFCVLQTAFSAVHDIDLLDFQSGPSKGYEIGGANAGANLGYCASGIGDFNGDGLNDAVVNGPTTSYGARTNAGGIFVIFGSRAFNSTYLNLKYFTSGSVGVAYYGPMANTGLGYFCSGGGDFNNDGYDDFMVGTHYLAGDSGEGNAGAVYLILGHGAPYVDVDLNSATPANRWMRIAGAAASHELSLNSFVGDVNGDGYDDIALGAANASPISNHEGIAYVVFGKSSISNINMGTYTLGTNLGFKMTGSIALNYFGAVGTAGDFNGDGYADALLMGTSASYVVFGHSTASNFPNLAQGSWVTSATTGFKITVTGAYPAGQDH